MLICIFRNDVVPIVMGAPPEDYAKVAPPGSYIHVDDFESPEHLADYLKVLDKNDELYNEYFRWKETGAFMNTKFWCRLCALAHEAHRTGTRVWYDNVNQWWSRENNNVCIHARAGAGWASWRNYTMNGYKSATSNLNIHVDNKHKLGG